MNNSIVKNVSGDEAKELINREDDLYIIDVRTPEEYKDGHIPGAKSYPLQQLGRKVSELEEYKDSPMLIYCASGGRSSRAIQFLLNYDFANIYHMNKGIASWKYELEK